MIGPALETDIVMFLPFLAEACVGKAAKHIRSRHSRAVQHFVAGLGIIICFVAETSRNMVVQGMELVLFVFASGV